VLFATADDGRLELVLGQPVLVARWLGSFVLFDGFRCGHCLVLRFGCSCMEYYPTWAG
jgi:hypothetical protein